MGWLVWGMTSHEAPCHGYKVYVLIPVFLAADAQPSLVVGVQESDAPSGSTDSRNQGQWNGSRFTMNGAF